MLIDWFTVGAQALNFLILFWLMKRFLYKPILEAIDAREKLVTTQLAEAEAKKGDAKKERDEFQQKNEEFDRERTALLNKATEEGKSERLRLMEEARKEADALMLKRQEALKNDSQALNQSIVARIQQEVFAIARMTLTDLSGMSLEAEMVRVFMARLRAMDDQTRERLATALKKTSEPACVRSAFELPVEQRAILQKTLNEVFLAEVKIQFEIQPNLAGGIEFITHGQKVAWCISDYLTSMEKGIGGILDRSTPVEIVPA